MFHHEVSVVAKRQTRPTPTACDDLQSTECATTSTKRLIGSAASDKTTSLMTNPATSLSPCKWLHGFTVNRTGVFQTTDLYSVRQFSTGIVAHYTRLYISTRTLMRFSLLVYSHPCAATNPPPFHLRLWESSISHAWSSRHDASSRRAASPHVPRQAPYHT